MADDNNFQNRNGNPSDRPAPSGGQGGDPLAELARLIGQNDPFADFGRDTRAQSTPPQRPPVGEAALASPSYYDPREKFGAPAQNQTDRPPPAFVQATPDRGGYRDSGYRDNGRSPQDHDFDIAEPSGGRKFLTKSTIITLAVIGVAGAVGYRYIFGDAGSNAPPRVIYSNPEPTKVPPPVANAEASPSKSTYDRVGDRGQGERLATREEAPVDVNNLPRQGGRNPPPPQNSTTQWTTAVTPNLPGSASAGTAPAPSAMGEPKRVRTVTIRPNQRDADMAQSSLTPPTASAPPQPARSAPPAPSAPVQQRASAAATQTAPPMANAPLSLADDAPPAPVRRSANAAPPARPAVAPRPPEPSNEAAPQPLAQVAAPKGSGYLVQVSSQRSEADAQAALRTVQAKFPNVLGGQQATVRRAEVGERGTFYRAMIGPFPNRDQATQLCSNLKAAGGDCIVAGN